MTPYYDDGTVTIYHGDNREVLDHVDAAHCVTDPPYAIDKDYGHGTDDWRPDHFFWRKLHDRVRHSLHMTVSNRHLNEWLIEAAEGGWQYLHTSVYWRETRSAGNWNGQFAYAWEPLLSFKKWSVPFRLEKRMMTDVFAHAGQKSTEHPAERDISMWKSFIDYLPGGTILDPFLGSGTTLRACKDLGRKAIGIEREERWCEEAANRCAQESLFVLH